MNILKSTFKRFGNAVRKYIGFGFDLVGRYALSKANSLLGDLGRAIYDKAYWLRAFDESLIVQVPVRALAEGFARPAWQLKRVEFSRTGPPIFRQIWQHPFLRLIEFPNESQIGIAFKEMMIRHWKCCGEVIIYIEERTALGEPSSMFLVEPHKLTETPMDNVEGVYRFTIDRGVEVLQVTADPKDIVYICDPSAFACHGRGVGQVTALSREVKLDEKSSQWSLAIYENGSHVGAIVHMPDVETKELEAMQEEWDAKYTGIENIGRTLFLSSDSIDGKSPMSVEKIGGNHKELDWTESKKDLLKRALILFGIPPQVVGQIEGGSRSDTSGADYIHQSKNIVPLLDRFTKEFQLRLLPQFRGTKNLVVTYENPVREEAAFVHARLTEGLKIGALDRDEWRAGKIELDPMGGKLGNSVSLPLNMTHTDLDGKPIIEGDYEAPAMREEDDADNAASSVALNAADQALELLKGLNLEYQEFST